jgi:phage baseplate assembly protein W
MMTDILGQGCQFPFGFGRRTGATVASTATSRDQAHIHESIRQILGTRRGERFLRPEFGCRLHELLFEGNDAILQGLVRHEVRDALLRWEPRIVVDDVVVSADTHTLSVDIRYHLIASQVESNLVLPFARGTA